jgi:hypothetical protein
VSGIRLLHAVNRQRSDGIYAELVQVLLRLRLTHVVSCAGEGIPALVWKVLVRSPQSIDKAWMRPARASCWIFCGATD